MGKRRKQLTNYGNYRMQMCAIFLGGTMQAYCYHIGISSSFPCSKVAMCILYYFQCVEGWYCERHVPTPNRQDPPVACLSMCVWHSKATRFASALTAMSYFLKLEAKQNRYQIVVVHTCMYTFSIYIYLLSIYRYIPSLYVYIYNYIYILSTIDKY